MFAFNIGKAVEQVKAHSRMGKKSMVFVHPYQRTSPTVAYKLAQKKELTSKEVEYLLRHYDTVINKLGYMTAMRYSMPMWVKDAAQDIRVGILQAHHAAVMGRQQKRKDVDWWRHLLNRGLRWANEKMKQVRNIVSMENERKDFADYARIRNHQASHEQRFSQEATMGELEKYTGMTSARIQALLDVYKNPIMMLNQPVSIEGEEGGKLSNLLSTGESAIDDAYARAELSKRLEELVIKKLNKQEYELFEYGLSHDADFSGFFGAGRVERLNGVLRTIYDMRKQGKILTDIAKHLKKTFYETQKLYLLMKKKSGVIDVAKHNPGEDKNKAQRIFDALVGRLAADSQVIALKEEYYASKSFFKAILSDDINHVDKLIWALTS